MPQMKPTLTAFAAGVLTTVTLGVLLGMRADPAPFTRPAAFQARSAPDPAKILSAEDQLADAEHRVWFWQQELELTDAEIVRLHAQAAQDPCSRHFLDRTQALSTRAATLAVDARLNYALCHRKLGTLKSGVP